MSRAVTLEASDTVRQSLTASSAPYLTPRAREIVVAARGLLEREGPDALTMRGLAQSLGVRAPSIYKHLASKDALEAAVISLGFEELAALFESAMDGASDPLETLAGTWRRFAREHPHLYFLMTGRPLRRDLLLPGSELASEQIFLAVAGGDRDLARAIWGFLHGMTILEVNDRFPPGAELEAAWRRGIDAFRHPVATGRPRQPARRVRDAQTRPAGRPEP